MTLGRKGNVSLDRRTSIQKDLAPRRLDRLRQIFKRDRVVRLDAIRTELGVSPATTRRDLDELERLGEIRRVHGGAVSIESRLEEPLFDDKTSINAKEKHRICKAALEYIKPNDTIFLDGGSTVLELARLLKDRSNISIVTNSLRSAIELAGAGPRLILVGGELRRLSQTLVGPLTRHMLQELHVDKAFMGTMGLTVDEGPTTTDPSEGYTKALVMEHARQVILLADHSKIGKVCFSHAGELKRVHLVITDKSADRAFEKRLRGLGVELQRV